MKTTKKILIVDDDTRNIFALKAVLRARGYECIAATSANDGINILNDNKDIGIVLMDMMMPDMDGYEAIEIIKSDEAICHTPVVAVTAQAMQGDKEKCLAAGANAYISKPINVELLAIILNEHINT